MPKVLITGGAGYIGTHIAAALIERGFDPLPVDDFSNSTPEAIKGLRDLTARDVEVRELDCRDTQAVIRLVESEEPLAGIIHLAAFKAVGESVRDPLKYYANNIAALVSVLRAAERIPEVPVVLSSSCTVYGQPDTTVVTEATPIGEPHSPYGYTKQVCERMLADWVRVEPGRRGTILRYFNPIGAHPSGKIGEWPLGEPDNLVPYITQTAAGLREVLTVFGNEYPTPDGTCIRDFIHVCDLAEAHVTALKNAAEHPESHCEVFNIGTGRGHSVAEVIETFRRVTGAELDVRYGPRRPGDVAAIYANTDKAAKHLQWRARRSLSEALKDAWNWQQTLSSDS